MDVQKSRDALPMAKTVDMLCVPVLGNCENIIRHSEENFLPFKSK